MEKTRYGGNSTEFFPAASISICDLAKAQHDMFCTKNGSLLNFRLIQSIYHALLYSKCFLALQHGNSGQRPRPRLVLLHPHGGGGGRRFSLVLRIGLQVFWTRIRLSGLRRRLGSGHGGLLKVQVIVGPGHWRVRVIVVFYFLFWTIVTWENFYAIKDYFMNYCFRRSLQRGRENSNMFFSRIHHDKTIPRRVRPDLTDVPLPVTW